MSDESDITNDDDIAEGGAEPSRPKPKRSFHVRRRAKQLQTQSHSVPEPGYVGDLSSPLNEHAASTCSNVENEKNADRKLKLHSASVVLMSHLFTWNSFALHELGLYFVSFPRNAVILFSLILVRNIV